MSKTWELSCFFLTNHFLGGNLWIFMWCPHPVISWLIPSGVIKPGNNGFNHVL